MIREWIRDNGTVARYDTVSQQIGLYSIEGENIDPFRAATDDERAEYLTFYPDASTDQINATTALNGLLSDTLTKLRDATADGSITPTEFATISPSVQAALTGYRDFNYKDADIDRLAFLVLSQVSLAYSIMLAGASTRLGLVTNTVLTFDTRLSEVERQIALLGNTP